MTVPREYTVNDFAINDTFAQATPATGAGATSGGNMLLQGATLRTSTAFGRTATVKAGEDIRPALESLRSAGGGTLLLLAGTHRPTYDIVGGSKINIIGEGIDQTIIDFGGGAYQIKYEGTTSVIFSNFKIENLTIQNSADTLGGIYVNLADDFNISYIKVYSCDYIGAYLRDVQNVLVERCLFDANTGNNFRLYGTDTRYTIGPAYSACLNIAITNCKSTNSSASGFSCEGYGAGACLKHLVMTNCIATNNAASGIDLISNHESYSTLLGCSAEDNATYGFNITAGRVSLYGCHAYSNSGCGFEVGANVLIGCQASLNTPEVNAGENSILIGNVLAYGAVYDAEAIFTQDLTTSANLQGNLHASVLSDKRVVRAKNTSGGALAVGDVVVIKPVAGTIEISTTTTAGDKNVYGMSLGAPSNNSWGHVLVYGETAALKVNGTTDIAIGDYLTTFTTAKIAQKAVTTGQMVFAVALEAYTANDSLGVIDAYLLPYHFPLP